MQLNLPRRQKILLYTVSSLIFGYVVLSVLVVTVSSSSLDEGVTLRLQRYSTPGLDRFMEFVSWFASIPGGLTSIGSMAVLFGLYRRWRTVGFLFAPLLVVPIVSVVKSIFNRARPTADVVRVVRDFNHASFPSGHVVFYTVLFGFVIYLMARSKFLPRAVRVGVGAFCAFLILTVPFSRMYLGAHWFTDVVAGFCLGCLLLVALVSVYNRVGAPALRA